MPLVKDLYIVAIFWKPLVKQSVSFAFNLWSDVLAYFLISN